VTTLIPEEPVPRHLKHSLREERALPQIGHLAHIRPHPVLGSSAWVGRRTDIEDMKWPGKRLINILLRRGVIPAETEVESINLGDGTP
jgi:hypothetical protein